MRSTGPPYVLGEEVALRRLDDVVLRRAHQQQRHAHAGVLVAERLDAVDQQRQQRLDRRALVGALLGVGIGDVAADPGQHGACRRRPSRGASSMTSGT